MLAGKSSSEISQQLAKIYGLTEEHAARDVLASLEAIPDAPARPTQDPCRWARVEPGYGFFDGERLICEVAPDGSSIRLCDAEVSTEAQARGYLKSIAPKVLALRGIFVLHAAAVEMEGAVTVFTGQSGAGKTTSARSFARTGARLVSEDLLVISFPASGPCAVLGGEAAIRAWTFEQAAQLLRGLRKWVACEGLDRCIEGEPLPIGQTLLISADRREGDQILRESLKPVDALVGSIESIYFASSDTRTWGDRVLRLRDLVTRVATFRATMPEGLPALDAAAHDLVYKEMTAS
jgi:hypothetical protein